MAMEIEDKVIFVSKKRKRLPSLTLPGILIVLGTFLLASCGSDSASPTPSVSQNTGLTDINETLVRPPTVVDVKPNSAALVAVTNQKVVCAVSYGPASSYGRISADSVMSPEGHTEHHHLLRGLQPDTEYHYRWSLIGPDGTVYRSEDLTFSTAPTVTSGSQTPTSENLALLGSGTRITGTSGNFGGGDNNSTWGANHAIDGDPGTEWSTDGDGDGAWIEIELPTKTHVTSLGFWTRTMGTSAEVLSFQVVTDVGEVHGPFNLDDASGIHYFPTDLTGKRLRFEAIDTSGGNTGAVEIEVYGEPAL